MNEAMQSIFNKFMWMFAAVVLVPMVIKIFFLWFNSPKRKGARAERVVANRLKSRLPAEYKVLNNVYLPLSDGTTAQIDHIVVSPYGVFVIETKNLTGRIFGSADAAEWTYRNNISFQNPLLQNHEHICALVENLQIDKAYFKNVVALTNNSELRMRLPENVISTRRVVEYILSFNKPVMTALQANEIADAIAEWQGTVDEERKANHVANLKKRHTAAREGDAPACPYCGGRMVLRTRKKDGAKFYGCESYPACRGIVNIA